MIKLNFSLIFYFFINIVMVLFLSVAIAVIKNRHAASAEANIANSVEEQTINAQADKHA